MDRLPLEVQTLYAELVDQLSALEAGRALGSTPGSFVTKTVKGQEYRYFQHVDASGTKRQVYLGRRDDALDLLAARYAEHRSDLVPDQESVQRLGALLRAGGASVTDSPSARVLKGLADAGVFRSGGVLVGTHAFLVMGNLLGVRWTGGGMRTQDVDLAAPRLLEVVAAETSVDLPGAIDSLEMGFLPVPGLDPSSPSTSFKVRGQPLRVDLLTPSRTIAQKPIMIRRFAAAAQPLKYLDYLIERPIRAAVVGSDPALVFVPDPARFALHKLLVASDRPATETTKRAKDVVQAGLLLDLLLDDRPADVTLAWRGLHERAASWARRVRAQATRLPDRVGERLLELTRS
jgi:hypothetical protein